MTRTITIEEPLSPCHNVLLPVTNFGVLVSRVLLHRAVDASDIPAVKLWAEATSTSCRGLILLAVEIVGCFEVRVLLLRHDQLQKCCSGSCMFVFLQTSRGPLGLEREQRHGQIYVHYVSLICCFPPFTTHLQSDKQTLPMRHRVCRALPCDF